MIYSKQREAIMEALLQMHGSHPSADALYASLKADFPSISLATVYRNLNQLADIGTIARIAMPSGANRFDDVLDGHLHMVCSACGEIQDIPADVAEGLCARATQRTHNEVQDYRILFYGLCESCAAAQRQAKGS